MYAQLTEWAIVAKLMIGNRIGEARDRGASALEYVGMLVVAGVIVAAIAGALDEGTIGGAVEDALAKILGT